MAKEQFDKNSALIERLRAKDAAITGTLLAKIQNPEFAKLVVGLKAAAQDAAAALEQTTLSHERRSMDCAVRCFAVTEEERCVDCPSRLPQAQPETTPSTTLRSRACPYCAHENSAIRETYFDQTCEGCVKRMGGEKAMRESVDEVLEIVGTYGPWGRDINEGLRYQIVLADEVKRLRSIPSATPCIAPMTLMEMRAALRFYANDDHRVWVTFKPGDRERVLQRMKDEPGWIETGEDSRGHEEFIETGARAQTALNLLTDSENDAIDEAMRAADGSTQS